MSACFFRLFIYSVYLLKECLIDRLAHLDHNYKAKWTRGDRYGKCSIKKL